MWLPGFLKRKLEQKAADTVADRLEQAGKDLAEGKGAPMDPKMKAVLEGAAWTVLAAALTALGGTLQDGFQPRHDLGIAAGAAVTAAAAYIRALGVSNPFREQTERSTDPPRG